MDIYAILLKNSDKQITIPASALPSRSLKTHPTQLYSAITAALLCAFLWFYFPYRRSEGEVFALMLVLYSIGRFLLEVIRRDEAGQFGTGLTISQWVSIGILMAGLALFAFVRRSPSDSSAKQ